MARADTKDIAIRKGLPTFLPTGGHELWVLEDAIRVFYVVMHHVTLVAVFSDKRGRSLILVRETPQKEREKQRSNEQYARDIAW